MESYRIVNVNVNGVEQNESEIGWAHSDHKKDQINIFSISQSFSSVAKCGRIDCEIAMQTNGHKIGIEITTPNAIHKIVETLVFN